MIILGSPWKFLRLLILLIFFIRSLSFLLPRWNDGRIKDRLMTDGMDDEFRWLLLRYSLFTSREPEFGWIIIGSHFQT